MGLEREDLKRRRRREAWSETDSVAINLDSMDSSPKSHPKTLASHILNKPDTGALSSVDGGTLPLSLSPFLYGVTTITHNVTTVRILFSSPKIGRR